MRFIYDICICGSVILTGCIAGEQRSVPPAAPVRRDAQNSTREICTQTPAPAFTRMLLNTEAVCKDRTAHLILEASSTSDARLEYRLEGTGLEIEQDTESPRAFLLSSMMPGREYTLKAMVGDGCSVTVASIQVGSDTACDSVPSSRELSETDWEFYRTTAWEDAVSMSHGI